MELTTKAISMRQCFWKIDNKLLLAFVFAVSSLVVQTAGQNSTANGLLVGFYNETCPQAETLVQKIVQLFFEDDRTVPAALLRLFFHDCFVRGCDASIMISSNMTNRAEQDASPNLTVRGLDVINAAKTAVENVCPGKVSCADIIALATRDAVFLANGPHWDVLTGRRDGRISLQADAENLPGPSDTAQQGINAFAAKGLSVLDFVCLLGAHTVGVSHCRFFSNRLFNFAGTGKPDPTMNPRLLKTLKQICSNPCKSTGYVPTVSLDQGTPFLFDTSYFKELIHGHGILRIDQQIGADNTTSKIVRAFASRSAHFDFSSHFATSMINLGNVEVKTGSEGEIRFKCNVINT
ncbi:hypothetical protein O6H91_14G060400 [Diphasiastrum complanatum]|uniref:Uncharacterized protein n=1 Tax=Diphasiastrum complanatum TaxID=34168 RepID=A0ACC2BQM2_DIPCM|nr:hypothetical protein O6H91_Y034300 [Diphasiastrum complanatum]KAJ7531819.1 hypothetical protein O6H91_14G060400 [Diphasiastrum complanatum]